MTADRPEAPAETEVFAVPPEDAGARVDVFVASRVAASRVAVQRGIDAGDVLVDGRTVRRSYRVRAGESVEVELPEPVTTELVPEDLPLAVLYEDDDVLVVEKPAGQVVHPAAGIVRGTLANALAFGFGRAASARNGAGDALRPGLVHRLDRDTSGLLVVARHDRALEHLGEQFRARTVAKRYAALVYGQLAHATGRIDLPIGRDRKNRLKMAVVRAGEGRASLTLFTVARQYDEFALLDVEIKTGRTHQIRVHLAHEGHPVVADEVYGKGLAARVRDVAHRAAVARLGRQFLHARALAFEHPRTGARMAFVSELPEDLRAMLAAIERPAQP
jgi:23S rRNA pseudouridine1911/1915/1917 synthase